MHARVLVVAALVALVAALAHVASTVNAQWRPPGKPMPLGSAKQCVWWGSGAGARAREREARSDGASRQEPRN